LRLPETNFLPKRPGSPGLYLSLDVFGSLLSAISHNDRVTAILSKSYSQKESEYDGSATNNRPDPLADGLSVDVEDYYHVEAFADKITPQMWPDLPSRVGDNTRRVLELLDRAGAKATFFVLGWVAERRPEIVGEILNAGHELGCHSYWHRRISRLTPDEFREDTRRALAAIEDAGGQAVPGYRAPTFSIVPQSLWALEILAEQGFVYDSSVFPVRHDLYGMPQAPRFPFLWNCANGLSVCEIPLPTVRMLGLNFPVAGGGYLRILPMRYTKWALRRIRRREHQPAVVYFHPWEIDPEQPRLRGRWKSVVRHYFNLKEMEPRLAALLSQRRFVPLGEYLRRSAERHPLPKWDLAFPVHEAALTLAR
jgi:polysaccharide deacetylase family protein (PEP-CTERM system associated)